MKLKHNPNYVNLPIRFLAGAIDTLIVWLVIISGAFFFFPANRPETLIIPAISYLTYYFLPISLISLIYTPFMHSRFGATIGQIITGLKVTTLSHQLLTFKQALFRYFIATLPIKSSLGIGYLSILFDDNHQGWHDHLAGSYVTKKHSRTIISLIILILLLICLISLIYFLLPRFI